MTKRKESIPPRPWPTHHGVIWAAEGEEALLPPGTILLSTVSGHMAVDVDGTQYLSGTVGATMWLHLREVARTLIRLREEGNEV